MTNALGHALPEKQFGTQPQVLRVFDKAEADHATLTSPELLLQNTKAAATSHRQTRDRTAAGGGVVTHLPVETLHNCRLPHVAHVHGDLGAAAEGLSVKEQYDGSFKLTADGRVHPGTDQHHPLQQPIRDQDIPTSI